MQFATNDEIGKYRIIGELGRGGMGVVYLAEDMNLSRQVSLKFLQGAISEDSTFKERFKREAQLVSSIVHPNIVQIHSLDELDGHLLIDMEYVEGQSLSGLMSDGPLSTSLASHLALDVLQGLAVCHRSGVIHRDIKPSNILLNTSGQGKIVDFGIATALADSGSNALAHGESTMVFMGTPRYTPPEAWEERAADVRWDVYALGVMMHEALTGAPAYNAKTMLSLMYEITSSPLPPIQSRVDGISSDLADVLNRMVAPDPENRIDSAEVAMKLIQECREATAYTAYDAPTITISIPKALKRKSEGGSLNRYAWVAALIGIATVSTLIGSAMMLRDPKTQSTPAQQASLASESGFVLPTGATPIAGVQSLEAVHVWRAEQVGAPEGRAWTLYTDSSSDGISEMYGFTDRSLIHVTVNQSDTRFTVEGHWAEYPNAAHTGFQSGTITGSGVQHGNAQGFTLTTLFHSDRDRSRTEETYYVSPNTDFTDKQSFVYAIESSEWLMPLMEYEIRSRRLSLGVEMKKLFPAMHDQRVNAPRTLNNPEFSVDGVLDEELWTKRYFGTGGRLGELQPSNVETATPMLVRHDGNTLYLGLVLSVDEGESANAHLTLRQTVEKPLGNSPQTELSVDKDGQVEVRHCVGGIESPIANTWEVASSLSDGVWSIEIRVPLVKEVIRNDGTGMLDTIRLSCETTIGGEDGPYWGAGKDESVAHGALIFLESIVAQ
jgi:serine/threonine protein kinase